MSFLTKIVAGVLMTLPAIAPAMAWEPEKPVTVVVHTGPGAGSDVLARAIISVIEKEKLSTARFTVVNKTGGGSTNAMNYISSREADDYTLALYASNWTTDYLVQKEATNSLQNLTPIANMIFEPAMITVRPDSPYKTLKEFIDAAKAEPNKLKQAGGSALGRDSLLRHALIANSGAQWPLISFPGTGERISAILGGHVDALVLDGSELGDFLEAGKLRGLAQVANERVAAFPADVPTIKEAGYDISIPLQPRGVVGAPKMSKEAAEYYQQLLGKVVASESWKTYVKESRLDTQFLAGADQKAFFDKNADAVRGILKSAGIEVIR
jgi:putative tricarboxylic transport membrane protein